MQFQYRTIQQCPPISFEIEKTSSTPLERVHRQRWFDLDTGHGLHLHSPRVQRQTYYLFIATIIRIKPMTRMMVARVWLRLKLGAWTSKSIVHLKHVRGRLPFTGDRLKRNRKPTMNASMRSRIIYDLKIFELPRMENVFIFKFDGMNDIECDHWFAKVRNKS